MKNRCEKVYPHQEKKITIRSFATLIVLHSLVGIVICIYSTYLLNSTNITWFLPIDVITLLIAIAFLNLIILVVGLSSAISNTSFAWGIFHVFMVFLILTEIMISYYTSDIKNVLNVARKSWFHSEDDEKSEIQRDLICCGFKDFTDNPSLPCPNENMTTIGCAEKLYDLTTKVCYLMMGYVFVSFLFTIFLDFIGCSLCYNPELVMYDEKTDVILNYSDRSENQGVLYEPLLEKQELYT